MLHRIPGSLSVPTAVGLYIFLPPTAADGQLPQSFDGSKITLAGKVCLAQNALRVLKSVVAQLNEAKLNESVAIACISPE